jgi:adenine-specific DNA methylase
MIPKECKKLAEVAFPIAGVSKHSAREKSILIWASEHPSPLVGASAAGCLPSYMPMMKY